MKINNIDHFRDGGTLLIETSEGNFCFDNRMNSETRYYMFNGYPKEDNSNIMSIEFSRKYTFDILNALFKEFTDNI